MNFPHHDDMNKSTIESTITDTPQSVSAPVLERIAGIRQSISDLAQDRAVLELVCSGTYHPDLRMGDAIQALDELAIALHEFQKTKIVPLPRLDTKSGVLISLNLHQVQEF